MCVSELSKRINAIMLSEARVLSVEVAREENTSRERRNKIKSQPDGQIQIASGNDGHCLVRIASCLN